MASGAAGIEVRDASMYAQFLDVLEKTGANRMLSRSSSSCHLGTTGRPLYLAMQYGLRLALATG